MELLMPRVSDFNIAVSETTKRRLVDLLKVDPDKIVVISNGVDLKRFNEISVEKKYGRILYVGRLESHKCVDTLLIAYHQLKKRYTDIELILVGKGPQTDEQQPRFDADVSHLLAGPKLGFHAADTWHAGCLLSVAR